jgi:hypothetical protein
MSNIKYIKSKFIKQSFSKPYIGFEPVLSTQKENLPTAGFRTKWREYYLDFTDMR